MNTFGTNLRLTSFGESHGPAIGGVIDGFPAGFRVDFEALEEFMRRRRPGSTPGSSARRESDCPEFLSGLLDGVTLGTPIAFIIRNTDCRPGDYAELEDVYRPNHADYTYQAKYGIRDARGGGRASARETAVRVCAGALAAQYLADSGIRTVAEIDSIGGIGGDRAAMDAAIEEARRSCDSLGGIVRCTITGVPAGVGSPVFGKLQAQLAAAMMGIPAAKGFEYGDGFAAAAARGSEQLDPFIPDGKGGITVASNHSGGIQGGITNGAPIVFRVAFKPIATMPGRTVETVDRNGRPTTVTYSGRHDVCAVPRALPVVEAMANLVLLDALLA